jgi:hypothetical protein
MICLLKQIIRKRHLGAFPGRVPEHGLFGSASKIEVCLKAKFLRFDLGRHPGNNALRRLA